MTELTQQQRAAYDGVKRALVTQGALFVPEWMRDMLRADFGPQVAFTDAPHLQEGSSFPFIGVAFVNIIRATIEECAVREGLISYDTALPQGWVEQAQARGLDPLGHFVWSYDGSIIGYPHPITREGRIIAGRLAMGVMNLK